MILKPAPVHWIEKIQFRQLKEDDLPALEWGGEYRHFRRLYREIYQNMLAGNAILWVADLEGVGVIGQLFVQLSSSRQELADGVKRAYIYSFRLKPPYRGHGVGTRFLQVVERDLYRRGYRQVNLNVNRDNPQARRLYERLGYRVVAAEPGRWSYRDDLDTWREVIEPAWRMVKTLSLSGTVKGVLE